MKSRTNKENTTNYCHYSGLPSVDAYRIIQDAVDMDLTEEEIDRVIEMAWEDRTPFEAIHSQWGLSEGEVILLMRQNLKRQSFKRWRTRVNSGVSKKHAKLRLKEVARFRCSRQRSISSNRIGKR